MGMRVGSASAAWSSNSTSSVQSVQQRQQGIKDLFAALKSGDLDAAKQAFASVAKMGQIDSNSPLGQLGQALQHNNLDAAQKLASAMQSNKATQPAMTLTQTNQNASLVDMLRTQGSNVNLLA